MKKKVEINLEQEYPGKGNLGEGTGKTDGLGSPDAKWEMGGTNVMGRTNQGSLGPGHLTKVEELQLR